MPALGLTLKGPPARRRSCLQSGAQGSQQHTASPARTGTWAGGQVLLLSDCCRQQFAQRKRPATQLSRRRENVCPAFRALLPRAHRHVAAMLAWQSHALQRRGQALPCMAWLRAGALPQQRSPRLRPRTTVAQSRSSSPTRRRNGAFRGSCRWILTTRRPRLAPSRRASCCCLGRYSRLARCAALSCCHRTSEVFWSLQCAICSVPWARRSLVPCCAMTACLHAKALPEASWQECCTSPLPVVARPSSPFWLAWVQIKPLVTNADAVMRWSKRVLSSALVDGVIFRTFFSHFCGGTDACVDRDSSIWVLGCNIHHCKRAQQYASCS